jgi:hypothetical protein
VSGVTNEPKLIPKISYKGVFIFLIILFAGVYLIPILLNFLGLSKSVSYFLAAGISSSIALILILTKIDAKKGDEVYFKKRIIISIIVGFTTSALMTFVFGGDVID